MTLKTSTQVESHLKPYTIIIKRFDPGTFPSEAGGTELLATPGAVTITSDASVDTFNFTVNDPVTTIESGATTATIPAIGDEILVRASNVGDNATTWESMFNMFKGFVTGVSRQSGDSGTVYSIECSSMKGRLNDEVIFKTYNEMFDNVNKPNFDESDNLLTETFWNVKQIIDDIVDRANKQILAMPAGSTPLIYFNKNDFDYSEVPELSSFIPEKLIFENVSVLEAIHRVITSAGTYRMVYDPIGDDIVFTRVSIKAYGAGNQRFLYYATANKTTPNNDYVTDTVAASYPLASGVVNVIRDNSVKRINSIASMYRMFGGKVEWYGGHSYIKDDVRDFDQTPNASGVYTEKNYNWDGYKYHFSTNNNFIDGRKLQIIVGCPLYPPAVDSYDYQTPMETYIRKFAEINDSTKVATIKDAITEATLTTRFEYTGYSRVDACIRSATVDKYITNEDASASLYGAVYEAWYPWMGQCLYCGGSGAVEDDSNLQAWNDSPNVYFGHTRYPEASGAFSAGDKIGPDLTPYDYQFVTRDGEQVPTRHPLPWKNVCPACRGVGREPKFKITNISNTLLDLEPSRMRVEDALINSDQKRTWSQIVADYKYSYPPQIQVETTYDGSANNVLAGESRSSYPAHPLAGLKPKSYNTSADPSGVSYIYEPNEKIEHLYKTTIDCVASDYQIDYKRGDVIFNKNAIFCKKSFRTLDRRVIDKRVYEQKSSSNGETLYTDRVSENITTYWRPSRAWITMYFSRDRLYDIFPEETLDYDAANRTGKNPKTFDIPPASGQPDELYRVQSSIADSRIYYEIYRKSADEGTEFDVRPVVKGKTVNEYRWQISPDDVYNLPVPESSNYSWTSPSGSLRDAFITNEYLYPEACVQVAEAITRLEYEDNSSLFNSDVVGSTTVYPKKLSWVQRDDRYRLIQDGVRELEKANDIQVTGNVVVRGTNFNIQSGLGYVTFDDGLKAVIVKMTHNFGAAFTTTLELSTEEYRIGQMTERDKDTQKLIDKKIYRTESDFTSRLEAVVRASKKPNKEVVTSEEKQNSVKQYGHLSLGE